MILSWLRLKYDGTRAEIRGRLSAKRTSPFESAGTSFQSTTDTRNVRISGSNVGYTMFRGSVRGTGYPFYSPVAPSLPLPCFTVCHHVSTRLYITVIGQVVKEDGEILLRSLSGMFTNTIDSSSSQNSVRGTPNWSINRLYHGQQHCYHQAPTVNQRLLPQLL
jgi:hypothetical protein